MAISYKEFLEREEQKQCTFKPFIGEVSRTLADKKRKDKSPRHIEDLLLDDADRRYKCKQKIDQFVTFT